MRRIFYFKLLILVVAVTHGLLSFAQDPQLDEESLSHLWTDAWRVSGATEIRPYYQFTGANTKPWRLNGDAYLTLEIDLLPQVSIAISPFLRIPVRLSQPPAPPSWREGPLIDLQDSYLKFDLDNVFVRFGFLLVPWVVTEGAQLNNRLNPMDYRVGQDFAPNQRAKMSQWGLVASTFFDSVELEGVFFVHNNPSAGSLIASEQGGADIGRYQGAFFNRPPAGTIKILQARETITQPQIFFLTPSVGLALKFRWAEIDWGVNGAWHYNDIPSITTNEDLYFEHTASMGLFAVYGFSLGILKLEALAQPKIDDFGGKTTLLYDSAQNITSQNFDFYALGAAFESGYGETITASIELFDVMWVGDRNGSAMVGLAPFDPKPGIFFNRLATALVLGGDIASTDLHWRIKSEFGISQPDILGYGEFRYTFVPSGLYIGVFSALFSGVADSPGDFRKDASKIGMFFGFQV